MSIFTFNIQCPKRGGGGGGGGDGHIPVHNKSNIRPRLFFAQIPIPLPVSFVYDPQQSSDPSLLFPVKNKRQMPVLI